MKYSAVLAMITAVISCQYPLQADVINTNQTPHGLVNFRGSSADSWNLIGVDDPRCIGVDLYLTWSEIEPTEGKFNWADLDAQMAPWINAGKKVALRFSTGGHRVQETPEWVFQSGVRRIVCREAPFYDFETDGEMQLSPGTLISANKGDVISGKNSLVLTDASATLSTKPELKLPLSEGMIVAFDAKMEAAGSITLQCISGDGTKTYNEKTFDLKAGETRPLEWNFTTPNAEGSRLLWRTSAPVSIDNVLVVRRSLRQYTYPVYWQPEFRQKLTDFIGAVASRYGNNPNILYFNINGIGRWEEAMIDTGDDWQDKSAKRQWLAQGYTQKSYLEQVKWSMDTWRKALPKGPLCLMVAYAMKDTGDESWNWIRLADEAAKRGVIVKQNGWSGKFSEWHDTNQFGWVAQRMRNQVPLVYEPGGGPNAGGLGTSMTYMNQALLDSPAMLTWYSYNWIDEPNQASLDFAAAALGKGEISTFYNLLQPMEDSYERKGNSKPVSNRNQQFGLIQWDDPDWLNRSFGGGGGKTVYDVKAGQPCIRTDQASKNPYINFDIDDRTTHRGMNGIVLMLNYFDEGTDSFRVELFNRQSGKYEPIKTVKKTNTSAWTRAYVTLPWYDAFAPMNPRNNTWKDVRINCMGDGDDAFANLQLNFAPVQGWATTSEPTTLQNTAPNEWVLRTKIPADLVHIPVSTPDNGANAATLSIYTDGVLVQQKSFSYVDNGDVWTLPLPPSNSTEYTLNLKVTSGSISLPSSLSEPAKATLLRYTSDDQGLVLDDKRDGRFRARKPWHELDLPHNASGRYQLQRLCGDEWLTVAAFNLRKQKLVNSAPMPAGQYRLFPALKPEQISYLVPQVPAPDTAIPEPIPGIVLAKWKGPELPSLSAISLESPRGLNVTAADRQYVRLSIRNNSANTLGKVYWRSADQEFGEERCMPFQLLPNDREVRTIRLFVSDSKAWSGQIDQIRVSLGGDWPDTGIISIKQIALCDSSPLNVTWTNTETFNAAPFGTDYAVRSGRIEEDDKKAERWTAVFTGDMAPGHYAAAEQEYPEHLFTAPSLPVEPSHDQLIKLRMWNGTSCRYAELMLWPKTGGTNWIGSRFALPSDAKIWMNLYVPVGQNSVWQSGVTGIRVSFIDDRVGTDLLGEQRIGVQQLAVVSTKPVISWKNLKPLQSPIRLLGQITATAQQVLQVSMTNTTERQNLVVSWGKQSINWPLLPGNQPQTVVIPIGEHPAWTGVINDLSIGLEQATLPSQGLSIELSEVTQQAEHKVYMGGDTAGWLPNESFGELVVNRSGEFNMKLLAAGGSISRELAKDETIEAKTGQVMRIRLRNGTAAMQLKLSWYPADARLAGSIPGITVPILPNSKSTDYLLPLGGLADWKGKIAGFKLEPCLGASKGDIGLSMIRIEGTAQPADENE